MYYNTKIMEKYSYRGDFNSRCGSESNDILCFDKYLDGDSDLFTDLPLRQSKDSVIDLRGRNLLSFCQVVDLCIANGRIECGDYARTKCSGLFVI